MGTYLVLLDCLLQSHFQIGKISTYLHVASNCLIQSMLVLLHKPIDLQASVDGYNYSLQTSGHLSAPYATSSVATVSNNSSVTHTADSMDTTRTPSTHPVTINTNTEETAREVTHTIYAQCYAKYLTGTSSSQRIYRSTTAEVKDKDEEVNVVVELILTETEGNVHNAYFDFWLYRYRNLNNFLSSI